MGTEGISIKQASGEGMRAYPKVWNLGHLATQDLLGIPVTVEEKIDGSLFSFGLFDGVVQCRSKRKQLVVDAPDKLFEHAVSTACDLVDQLRDGWVYHSEYVASPKHNVLAYSRVPREYVIVFDVQQPDGRFLLPDDRAKVVDAMGLECVPVLREGLTQVADIVALLDAESIMGGTTIEGVVIKPAKYDLFGRDGKVIFGKHVNARFREALAKQWPVRESIIEAIITQLRTSARWEKAVQHLRDDGRLQGGPEDIGPLMNECQADVFLEEVDTLKAKLVAWAWPQIRRGITRGLPEWYKGRLLEEMDDRAEGDAAANGKAEEIERIREAGRLL